jgi:hypothetical protein
VVGGYRSLLPDVAAVCADKVEFLQSVSLLPVGVADREAYHVGLSSTLLRLEEDGFALLAARARLVDSRQLSRINVRLIF